MALLVSEYDKSKYLRAEDLKHETKFRIKEVTEELIGQGADRERKLVVWFTNDDRGFVLSAKTNIRTLRGAFGDDAELWGDRVIVVFPTTTDLRGKMVPCLRVRIPPPKQPGNGAAARPSAAAPEPKPEPVQSLSDEMGDEIPFS